MAIVRRALVGLFCWLDGGVTTLDGFSFCKALGMMVVAARNGGVNEAAVGGGADCVVAARVFSFGFGPF